jgi:hypothetical protein
MPAKRLPAPDEDRYWDLPDERHKKKFRDYQIGYFYQAGEQLNVFG